MPHYPALNSRSAEPNRLAIVGFAALAAVAALASWGFVALAFRF